MKIPKFFVCGLALVVGMMGRSEAVMFADTADIMHNTSTPGDNSGWQYEGKFMTFLGVPIAPYFFITAKHFGGSVGEIFDFHGDTYTTTGYYETVFSNAVLVSRHHTASGYTDTPISGTATTDLRIWEVNHAKPFPVYAPLSSGAADIGASAMILGRGTRRGAEVVVGGEPKGWLWGASDDVQRWGRNVVTGGFNDPTYGSLLYCGFDKPGITDECHLSTGDSGGGLFVMENGLWRLAGIHLGVDSASPGVNGSSGSFYDLGGLYLYNGSAWILIPENASNIPSSFYSSRISASLPWITGIAPEVNSLAPESYSAWQRFYFTPTQIATPQTSGALGDFDNDGFSNLLEFAFNLDPSFNERATMIAATGLRGLPLVLRETLSGADHVTIEFVRRTVGSGAGLSYLPQFSSDLNTWEAVGTVSVTAINSRWERVKVVDPLTTGDTPKRFARVKVNLAE